MKRLIGNPLTEFPFQNISKVGDLVNYNGPLLSLFTNEKGELFLFYWVDNNETYNRWLIIKITLTQLMQYLNKTISHYQLITTYFSDYIVSADLDNDLGYHNITLLTVSDVPYEYLPDKNVLHDDNESPHIEKIKGYIDQLKLKAAEERKCRWQDKFKTGISDDLLSQSVETISNREQLLAVA